MYYTFLFGVIPAKFHQDLRLQKTKAPYMLTAGAGFLIRRSAISMQHRHVRDRRTDRRTSYARHDEIYYVIADLLSAALTGCRPYRERENINSFLFACGRLRSATTALTLRYVSEFSLAITENNVRGTLRNGALRRAAMRNFHGTFIVNVRSLRCVAYRTVHRPTQCKRITL